MDPSILRGYSCDLKFTGMFSGNDFVNLFYLLVLFALDRKSTDYRVLYKKHDWCFEGKIIRMNPLIPILSVSSSTSAHRQTSRGWSLEIVSWF